MNSRTYKTENFAINVSRHVMDAVEFFRATVHKRGDGEAITPLGWCDGAKTARQAVKLACEPIPRRRVVTKAKAQRIILDAAANWAAEIDNYIAPGAESDESRKRYEQQSEDIYSAIELLEGAK